jgi:hypothetical protein
VKNVKYERGERLKGKIHILEENQNLLLYIKAETNLVSEKLCLEKKTKQKREREREAKVEVSSARYYI